MNLGRAGLLARKEWKESFNSPTPYIALGLFFILIGWFWTSALFLTGQATMEEFFAPLPLLLGLVLAAAACKRSEDHQPPLPQSAVSVPAVAASRLAAGPTADAGVKGLARPLPAGR